MKQLSLENNISFLIDEKLVFLCCLFDLIYKENVIIFDEK
jgi:hypothetical protein